MERKDFLKKGLGLIGVSSVIIDACKKDGLNDSDVLTSVSEDLSTESCIVSPGETEGPYPYPGGEKNNPLNRVDVTEGKPGLPLYLTFSVVNTNDNCNLVSGARVDIWHCDRDGYYSGYKQNGYLGNKDLTGQTFMRGYQITDANGQCKFTTIYPGWYPGRATHIHIEVFINGVLKKTTQIAFPDKANKKVYTTAGYTAHGQNPTNNLADSVFVNSLASELATIDSYSAAGVHVSYQIGIAL